MFRSILLLFTAVLLTGFLHAQTRTIDSLRQLVYNAKGKKETLQAILNLCEENQNLNRDTMDYYAYRAKVLAQESGEKKMIDLAAIAMANAYQRWGWSDSAVSIIEPVVKGNRVEISEERAIHFKAARLQAMYLGGKGKYAESLTILYKLVTDAERFGDTLTTSANMNTIGSIDLARGIPYSALIWLHRALKFLTYEHRFDMVRAAIYVNMGEAYLLTSRADSAVWYVKQGVGLFRQGQNLMTLGLALQRQSNIYLKTGNLSDAETALKEMVNIRERTGDNIWVDDNLTLIEFYLNTKQVDKAIEYCKSLLTRGNVYSDTHGDKGKLLTNTLSIRLLYYEALSRCYKLKGDEMMYGKTLEQIIQAKDSLTNIENEQAIAELQTKYEVQKKENTIMQQRLTIVQKNNTLLFGLGIGVIVIIIAYFLFRDYRKKQRLKVERAIENEKKLSAKAIADAEENERKRIAADLHDNLGAYAASIASNLDILQSDHLSGQHQIALQELNNNSQTIVAQLSDTIWALNKDTLTLTAISDRVKVFLNRIRKSYSNIEMEVLEKIDEDAELPPTQAFHLFQIIQEAITNAVKHSGTQRLLVQVTGGRQWKIMVTDYGKGIGDIDNVEQGGGNGLRNMKARAAVSGWLVTWAASRPVGITVQIQPMEG